MPPLKAQASRPHLYSLDLIKALGIVLVINSHFDGIYQNSYLATGGALGNSLFFLASGIGLGYGWSQHGTMKFGEWFKRRILRIYPSLTILNLVFAALTYQAFTQKSLPQILSFALYPTAYFFIAAIMLFYIPGYFLLRLQSTKAIVASILLSIGIYFAWYTQTDLSFFSIEGDSYFRWIFYFIVFTIGLLYARLRTFDSTKDPLSSKLSSVLVPITNHGGPALACSLILFGVSKFVFRESPQFIMNFQFIVHFFTLALTWYIFVVSESAAGFLRRTFAWPLISLLSAITLELYLFDRYVDPYIRTSNELINSFNLIFPIEFKSRLLAVAVLWLLLIILAAALSQLSKQVVAMLFKGNPSRQRQNTNASPEKPLATFVRK